MWSSRFRKGFFLPAAVVLAGLLGACGFQPLYGKQQAGTAADARLASIEIAQIKDRIGQMLRNHLLVRLSPLGEPADPLYRLTVTLNESTSNLGVRKSAVVTRGNLKISASYTLFGEQGDGEGDGSLASGTLQAISSYDISQEQYAVQAALKDARARAVRQIADELKTHLAVYFRHNPD